MEKFGTSQMQCQTQEWNAPILLSVNEMIPGSGVSTDVTACCSHTEK